MKVKAVVDASMATENGGLEALDHLVVFCLENV